MASIFRFLIILCFCLVPLTACSEEESTVNPSQAEQVEDGYERKPLKITTQDGRDLYFQVEVADTPEEAAKGLMYREELAADHGMIFLFPDVKPRSFWMRNTYLALDVIFLDETGTIVTIGEGKPLSEAAIPSHVPAKAAIEFNRGTAEKMGIQVGDKVYFLGLNN